MKHIDIHRGSSTLQGRFYMPETIHHTRTEKLLLEAARTFNSTLEYEELIESVLRLVITAVRSESAMIFRLDHKRPDIKIRFMNCVDCRMRVFHRPLNGDLLSWVARYKEPVIINSPSGDPRCDSELERLAGIEINSLLAVPLIGKGQMIGVVEAINHQSGNFSDQDLDVLIGLNNQIAVAVDNAHLYREVKREALEKDLLYDIGKKLSSSLTLDELLNAILESLRRVVDYNAGGVFLVDPERGQIESVSMSGYPTACDEKIRLKVGQGLIGHVASSGEAVIVSDVHKDKRYVQANPSTRSEIVVPILLEGELSGVINLESDEVNAYDHRSLSLVTAFASQAAVSIERAQLHQSLIEGHKLREQLNIARHMQRTFLPETDPQLPGYDITGTNISSQEVGGDYFDFINIVNSHIGVAIADVSGKGIPAALIMASFRASLLAEIRNNYSIRTICEKVNALLCESLERDNFVTAVYGVLDIRNHVFTFANCGHTLPILLRADGNVEYLKEGGPLFGVVKDAKYEEQAVVLGSGDILLLYTDGVSEVFDSSDIEFGSKGLVDLLQKNRSGSAVEIRDAIHKAAHEHAAPDHTFDDLTMIVIKRNQD